MPTWAARAKGSLERLNGSLVVFYDPKNNVVTVDHTKYGSLCEIDEDDSNPVLMVREILSEIIMGEK